MNKYFVNNDIRIAKTLPASVYNDPKIFNFFAENLFLPSWQLVPSYLMIPKGVNTIPFTFLDPMIPEPLLMV